MTGWVVVVALAVTASACGSSGGAASVSPSPSPATQAPSPSPSPSGLSFKINGVKTTAAGTITVISQPPSVSIEVVISGLQALSSHVSHVHAGSCQQPGSIVFALNMVVADGQGNADTKSTLSATYPPATGTWYVVVHAGPDMQGSNAAYLLCGNLFA